MKSRRPRGRKEKGEGRGRNEGEFFTTPPIDSGKRVVDVDGGDGAGKGTMREMEGGKEMRGRQARKRKEECPNGREVEVGIGK